MLGCIFGRDNQSMGGCCGNGSDGGGGVNCSGDSVGSGGGADGCGHIVGSGSGDCDARKECIPFPSADTIYG